VRHAAGLGAATSVRFVPITLPAAKVPNPSGDLGATPGQCWAAISRPPLTPSGAYPTPQRPTLTSTHKNTDNRSPPGHLSG
jgi:hypothetical protein